MADERSPRTQGPRTDEGPSERDRPTRRSVLASAGAAVAGLAGTGGCIELLPPMGRETRFEDVDLPEAPPPGYREWIPSPSAREGFDLDPDLVAIPNNEAEQVLGVPLDTGAAFLASRVDYFGVGLENYDLAFALSGHPNDIVVLEGPVAPVEVGQTLVQSGYRPDGAVEGYDRYVRSDIPRTVAVTDGRILFGTGPERDTAIQVARDAHAGRIARATDDPAFQRIVDATGLRPFTMFGATHPREPDDRAVEQRTSGFDFDEADLYYYSYTVYEGAAPSVETIREEVEEMGMASDAAAVEIDSDGPFAAVEVRFSDDTVQTDFADDVVHPPQITWGVEANADAYVLRHEAGEAVPAERLTLQEGWGDDVALETQFTQSYATVGPGDTIRVPRNEIDQGPLVVQWQWGDSTSPLLQYTP